MRISDWSSDVCSSDLLAAKRRIENLFLYTGVDIQLGAYFMDDLLLFLSALGLFEFFEKFLYLSMAFGQKLRRVCRARLRHDYLLACWPLNQQEVFLVPWVDKHFVVGEKRPANITQAFWPAQR